MIGKIIEASLRNRTLVVLGMFAVIIMGIFVYRSIPVDAFPDISPVMVPVYAEAHGISPEEVERLISYPIESSMNGLPGVTRIKSTSAFGLAVVYVYFEDNINIYFARQLVSERLVAAIVDLPEMDEPPGLGPISTGLGQIFIYYLTADQNIDTGGMPLDMYLRDLNDRVVKYQLQTVPGVTEVLSMGGNVLQYQIKPDPRALLEYDVSMEDIIEAVNSNNRNAGGQFLVIGSEEHLVRGIGLLTSLDDIRGLPLKTIDGIPVRISDIALVELGSEIRRGVVTNNGEREVVSGIVLKLYGENTSEVIERLYNKVDEVRANLPEGVQLIPYYEQSELVSNATGTVNNALLLGGLLVLVTLAFFLGNLRTSLIVALALPFSALTAFILMKVFGISANLMSLGGIAVAIGMLCDGAIIMVENIYRHLNIPANSGQNKNRVILDSAKEVGNPIAFSTFIIILVFLPIMTLQGVEGKMFTPMALTISFALLGSIIMALMITPVLSSFLLKKGKHTEFLVLTKLKNLYRPAISWAVKHKKKVVLIALAIFTASMAALPFIGTEFVPTLEEGSIFIGVAMAPSISLEEATSTIMTLERRILEYDAIEETVSRIGRPEVGSHPHPVNYGEIQIELKPQSQWSDFNSKEEIVEALREDLSGYPGVQLNFTQPIQNAFDELLSGTRAELAIKLYGEDLEVLRSKSAEIAAAIENVPGLVDMAAEQGFGQPQIQIIPDRAACARYGVSVAEILELVELSIGGEVIDDMYLNVRRYGIHLRLQEQYRDDPDVIHSLLVHTEDSTLIPLSMVADIHEVIGPIQINREKNQRYWTVQGNIDGRDLGSVVADVQQRIQDNVELPPGYFVEYGGQFANQQRAMKRLSIIIPIVIAGILILLRMSFGVMRHALIIILNIPLALIGGIMGLLLTGEYLSVPAAVGFIALFGVALLDGVVLVRYFNHHRSKGIDLDAALVEGSLLRLQPVLITSVTTVLGLLPLLLSTGMGSEVQRPLATVVVFGLTTSTLLTLFVIPAVYGWIEEKLDPSLRR
ncbi:MAG: CusA/CzcA family heavy metal efflux RND transporter [Candidatus Aegiribacteria sp.]|nr:CusA/CzcA family heavy metal efflux RND transporter [Candidatus Aegiribacteria sp.]